jgi:predicted MFS family arabinose efflux permease
MAPTVFGAFFGGAVIDRVAPRLVTVTSDLACCITVGVITLLQLAGTLRFWELCALMAAAGLLHAPGDAARMVMMPALAKDAQIPLPRAAGFYAGSSRAASALGAAAGGLIVVTLGVAQTLLIDAATFAVSAVLILLGVRLPRMVRRPGTRRSRAGRQWSRELGDGVRLIARTPILTGIRVIGTITAVSLAATPLGALAAGLLITRWGLATTTLAFGGVYLAVTLAPVRFPVYKQMSVNQLGS